MTRIGYVRMEEVPGIPVLPRTPGAVVYAPLGDTPVDPDVVLVAGRPGRLMLLLEAAGRAGVATQPGLLGRPTCMALPAALVRLPDGAAVPWAWGINGAASALGIVLATMAAMEWGYAAVLAGSGLLYAVSAVLLGRRAASLA